MQSRIQRTESPSSSSQSRTSASEQVYDKLKEEILWGEIEPGTMLSELKLAARFQVSRTPVREALTMLASDGLTITLPQRGHLVRTIPFSEIVAAFRLRELLEVEAAGQASQRITAQQLAYLNDMAQTRDRVDLPAINREFHMTVARATGNHILADFIERLLILMQCVMIKDPHLLSWTEEGMQEEAAIIEALTAHDQDAAREAMRTHIRNTLTSILRELDAPCDFAI